MLPFIPTAPQPRSPGAFFVTALSSALLAALLAAVLMTSATSAAAPAPARWWSGAADQALARAGTNRPQMATALVDAPIGQREGLQFLLENMPTPDLEKLSSHYLLENTALAYDAMAKAPWRERIPREIFLNDILPYACLNETRDDWRKMLQEKCASLIQDCTTPAEAAQRINQKLFRLIQVKYSTQRKKADQSPLESMETGLATCTGLSILLVDACRSVGVPARVAATPLWFNQRGNHTWVEIWDGDWHFTGAAEQDPKGLDRGWFRHDASQALKDVPRHAIYASSFARTGLSFPLVWAPTVEYVSAVNVTDRYTPKTSPAETNQVRLLVKVLDRPAGQRVAAKVIVRETTNAAARLEGTSKGESADLNDLLPFVLARDRVYEIRVEQEGRTKQKEFRPGTNGQELVVLTMEDTPQFTMPSQACYAPPPVAHPLKPADEAKLKKEVTAFFLASSNQQAKWKFSGSLEKLLRKEEPAVRQAAWEAFRDAPLQAELKQDFDARQVRFNKYRSPYTMKTVGTRPPKGWALFIAMHGGGGAPKELNDSQWEHMQIYYRDHPEAGGYLYVALRAPNDSWNGFYDVYVYPLVANLIREFLVFGEVNPNKVFIMGYSHGGYGAFAIGPKIPDRFAAIHASAAAPTDGETTPKTLRHTIFTCMVGEKDTMYGRYERDQKFRDAVDKLRGDRRDIYPVAVQIIPGNGHTGLPDRDKIKEMYPAVRNPVPPDLTWLMTDKVIKDFFWLRTDAPGKQREINALCRDNAITVTTTTNVTSGTVLLDGRLVDFGKPVTLAVNGVSSRAKKLKPSLQVLCETLARRGDPELAFTAKMDFAPKNSAKP